MTTIEIRILAVVAIIAVAVVLVVLARLGQWVADAVAGRAARVHPREERPRAPQAGDVTSHTVLTRQEFWRLRC
jgi:hypothetical protein